MRENNGPLKEIAYWKSRSAKLSNISQHLQKPGIRHIQKILLLSKSRYVQDFCKLVQEIQVPGFSSLEGFSLVPLITAATLQAKKFENVDMRSFVAMTEAYC